MCRNIVYNIGGFCVRSVLKQNICETCCDFLVKKDDEYIPEQDLVDLKSMGFYKYPSNLMSKMFQEVENFFRNSVCSDYEKLVFDVNYDALIEKVIFVCTANGLFNSIEEHFSLCHQNEDYLTVLLLPLIEKFLKVRFHYAAKKCSEIIKTKNLKSNLSRQQSTRITHVNGL